MIGSDILALRRQPGDKLIALLVRGNADGQFHAAVFPRFIVHKDRNDAQVAVRTHFAQFQSGLYADARAGDRAVAVMLSIIFQALLEK